MIHLRRLLPALLLYALGTQLCAVTVMSRSIRNKAIYGIDFGDGLRAYYGKEEAVLSISQQEYVTAAFRVLELNIVTDGTAMLRIYYSRPLRAGELAQALSDTGTAAGIPAGSIIQQPLPPQVQAMADRASSVAEAATSSTVIKEYPIATHAHTIEYRINSREELIELHNELKKHWLKEPAYYEAGQIVDEQDAVDTEMKPRSLGGTLFKVNG